MAKKNPNEPKLDTIKLTPKIKLIDKPAHISPKLPKNDPFIKWVNNDKSR